MSEKIFTQHLPREYLFEVGLAGSGKIFAQHLPLEYLFEAGFARSEKIFTQHLPRECLFDAGVARSEKIFTQHHRVNIFSRQVLHGQKTGNQLAVAGGTAARRVFRTLLKKLRKNPLGKPS